MIETRLDEMLSMLRRGDILGEVAFSGVNLWDALIARENDESYRYFFSSELSDRWRILPIHADLRGIFSELKAESYDRARQQIEAFGCDSADRDSTTLVQELSSRIQHEIGEIAMSRATEFATPWHDKLWDSYSRNEIPMIDAEPIVNAIRQKGRVE